MLLLWVLVGLPAFQSRARTPRMPGWVCAAPPLSMGMQLLG